MTVNVAVTDVLLAVAVIVAAVDVATAVVVIVKVAEVAPADTVTLDGGTALVLLDERATTKPPVGAGPLIVTVPVDEVPPVTEVGATVNVVGTGGMIVSVAVTDVPPAVAVIVAAVDVATAVVVIVKVAEVAPAATVTLEGGTALVLLEVSATASPPVGAGPVIVSVPVDEVPPITEVGETASVFGTGGVIVKTAVADVPAAVAVIVALVEVATAVVVIVKVADVDPAATVTLEGGTALVLLDDNVTGIPPVGAGPVSVTVPVEDVPPTTDVGETVRVLGTGGVIVRTAVAEVLLAVAVIVAAVDAATGVVAMVNEPVVAPAATVTFAGGTALVLLDERVTTKPPEGAGPLSVTVPVDDVPPTTDVGDNVSVPGTGGVIVSVAVTGVPPAVAVIVALVDVATAVVAIVKVADVDPAVTVTLEGGTALVLLDVRATTNPPVGAGPLIVKVPVEDVPPTTDVGATVRVFGTGGTTVNVAVTDVLLAVAVIVAAVDVATAVVVIVKVAEVAPADTVTLDGGTALVLLDERATTKPPVGAGPLIVTVPVDEVPPVTEVGATVNVVGTGGMIVSVAVTDVPPAVAVIVAAVDVATAVVVIVKVAEVAPAATVTLEGGTALVLLEVSATASPPVGAGPVIVSVPVDEVPPITEVGETASVFGTGGMIVRVVVTVVPREFAVTVAVVDVATGVVAMVNVPVVEPAATVTFVGVVALVLLDERLMIRPPEGAAPFNVMVPVEAAPPVTEVGDTATLCK